MQCYSHELELTAREHSRIQSSLTGFALQAAQVATPNILRDEFRGLAPANKHHLKSATPAPAIVIKGERPFGLDDSLPEYDFFAMLPVDKAGSPLVISTPARIEGSRLMSPQIFNARDKINATHATQTAGQVFYGLGKLLGTPEIAGLAHPRSKYSVHAAMVLLSKALEPLASRRNRTSTFLSGGVEMSYNPASVFMQSSDFYVSEHGVELTVNQELNRQLEKRRKKPISIDRIRLTTLGTIAIGLNDVIQQFRYEYTVGSKEPPKAFLDSWSHTMDEGSLAILTAGSDVEPYDVVTQAIDRIYSSDFN